MLRYNMEITIMSYYCQPPPPPHPPPRPPPEKGVLNKILHVRLGSSPRGSNPSLLSTIQFYFIEMVYIQNQDQNTNALPSIP